MIPDDTIARLRGDRVELERISRTIGAVEHSWSSRPEVAPVLEALSRFGAGAKLATCTAMAELFEQTSAARSLAQSWVGDYLAGLSAEPLGQPAFAYQHSANATVAVLARSEAAELSLVSYGPCEGNVGSFPENVYFAPSARYETVLAGCATALIIRHNPRREGSAGFAYKRRELVEGDVLIQTGIHETKVLERVTGRLVVLRLTRTLPDAGPAREIRLADGALVHQSSSDKHESCQEMMMAVLGRMGRKDATPAMAALAGKGSEHLRWQAMRQCLALDAAEGFAILTEMARSADDPLAAPAGALRAQLLEAYPELAPMEEAACPA